MSRKTKATATKEEARPVLVPKLRFPEFREAEGWKTTPLGALGAIVTGKTPSTKEDELWGGKILFITPTDITEDEKYQHTTQRTVIETTGTKVLPLGSVVYTCIASIGKMALTVVPSVTNQQINAVVPNGKTAREFIYYALANLTPWIKSIPATSTLPIINKTQFSQFIIPHPENKQEQQKIAECLSSVDELMAAQARKVDALKTHKKGLMQQLFPREGETMPRHRFPEFRKAGVWKLRKIGDMLAETQRPIELSDDAEYRLVTVKRRYGGLIARGILKGREILVKSQFVVRAGDFLISKRQIVHNACGLVPKDLDGSVVSNEYSVLTSKPECSIEFFSWFAMQPAVSESFMNCSVGIVIEKVLFKLPAWLKQEFHFPTLPEQHRIASCLTTLDALIAAETQKLDALKTHKKGLMQQLFPCPEGVDA